jgi:hypothetical protein
MNVRNLAVAGVLTCTGFNLFAQDEPGRWYLGLDAGLALQQDITLENACGDKLAFDPGFRLDRPAQLAACLHQFGRRNLV